jgi:hypothetical protein
MMQLMELDDPRIVRPLIQRLERFYKKFRLFGGYSNWNLAFTQAFSVAIRLTGLPALRGLSL